MLSRSISTLFSHPPNNSLIKKSLQLPICTVPPLKHRNLQTPPQTPSTTPFTKSSRSSSSSSSSSNKKSRFTKAALLALPTITLITSDDDNKENESPHISSLKCASSPSSSPLPSPALSPRPSLKDSNSFLTPMDYTVYDTQLCIGVSIIPHPAKRAKGGEDAYFISDDMKTIGIADGVGGWGDIGVDPALYSRMLMASGKYSADCSHPYNRDPVEIMVDAYEHSLDVQGSSTCCIMTLDGFCLRTANLGDSGFMIIRGSHIIFRSKEQQHSFNFPYQLGTGSADLPTHAVSVTVNIQPGDLVVLGTDGLWDNLFDDEIIEIVAQASEPMTIAQLIARNAHETASSKTVVSPFAKSARENGYPLATGGKMDDITVVVARVVLGNDDNLPTFAA